MRPQTPSFGLRFSLVFNPLQSASVGLRLNKLANSFIGFEDEKVLNLGVEKIQNRENAALGRMVEWQTHRT